MLADAHISSLGYLWEGRVTRERDPGNKLVRRMSGAEPAARRGSGELSGEQRRVCIFAINKRIFKSFLL